MENKKTIALDADGVLLDYNLAYASAWQRAFGDYPREKDPHAYWAIDRWDVQRLAGSDLAKFKSCFDAAFWSSLTALPGALEACHALDAAGFNLVCVTALPERFGAARLDNLRHLGFPITQVHTADQPYEDRSPKADCLHALQPVAFVDDYAPFLAGVATQIHCALIHRRVTQSPYSSDQLALAASHHADLLDFANWWLG